MPASVAASLLLLALASAAGCARPAERREPPARSAVSDVVHAAATDPLATPQGVPMVPLAPRSPEPPAHEAVVAPSSVTHAVVRGEHRLGRHRFFPETLHLGPWVVDGASTEPGDEEVEVIGRALHRCRTSEVGATRVTWCPGVGVVARVGRDRTWDVDERLAVVRFDDGATWGSSPCDGMSLVAAEERRALCERPIRMLGAGPRRDGEGCWWRYTLDAPGPHDAVVEVRLAPSASDLEAWTGPVRARTSIARGERAAVAVRIDGARCGASDGAAFAERLAALTPE